MEEKNDFERVNLVRFIFFIALITPAMPKIKISEGVTIYLLEFFLILFFPLFIYRFSKLKFKFQYYLLGMWLFILIATLLSNLVFFDLGGLMRVVKGIVYIPLGYISYQFFKDNHLKFFLNVGIFASIFSLLFLIFNITKYGINIWDVRTIGSGLSNRSISISDFVLGTSEIGAHGIWGNYCVLVLMIAFFCYHTNKIKLLFFIFVSGLSLVGIGMSVSREAMITLFFLFLGVYYNGISFKRIKITRSLFIGTFIGLFFLIGVIIFFGDQIPILQKLSYTVESVQSSGTESNIQLRINGWRVFFESLFIQPEKIFTGYGYNLEYYSSHLDFARNRIGFDFVALPESYFIFAFCFGGVGALIFSVLYVWELISVAISIKDDYFRNLVVFFLCGLLIGNTLSGASILSDLLYGQLLIFFGYLRYKQDEENIADYC